MQAEHRSTSSPAPPRTGRAWYRAAIASSVVATLVLLWLSLGVGIIGADGDPANRMYFGVAAIGVVGAAIARLRARGMARVLFAMAAAQALVCAIALLGRLGLPWSGPLELLLLNGFFVAMFCLCGWMFVRSARDDRADATPAVRGA